MKLRILLPVLALLIIMENASAKEWRGIVPLKSTRAEVERRFGKPNERGDYELNDERVSIDYADGPCVDLYFTLGKENCKCLVAKGTVMSIYVQPTVKRKFSGLKLDLTRFTRQAIVPYPDNFAYYNPTEGVDYTVDESEDEIKTIDYYSSVADCVEVISKHTPIYRNEWRGLRPLHATRRDVERLLGPPQRTWEQNALYTTDHEAITVKYVEGNCDEPNAEWKVPIGTVVELVIGQRYPFLLKRLNLDDARYERHEQTPLPEIPNPPKVVNYIDRAAGIDVRAQSTGGPEEVVSITYLPAMKDHMLRCKK